MNLSTCAVEALIKKNLKKKLKLKKCRSGCDNRIKKNLERKTNFGRGGAGVNKLGMGQVLKQCRSP